MSRSPSIVTVALQLPESEAREATNGRILDKFPSTTTLWLVLRKFEAGVAGGGPVRNLTARGVPAHTGGDTGSGRLFYEIPVLQILERELSSFTDLQKTLAQLGFNSGNVLIRLSFRRTEEPLEEAMIKIGEYFKGSEEVAPAPAQTQAPATSTEATTQEPPEEPLETAPPAKAGELPPAAAADRGGPPHVPTEEFASAPTSDRPITVYSPPSANTPSSAQTPYIEEDYIPSVEHAKAHQKLLNQTSRPQRLPTDAEIAAKAAAEEKRRSEIREVDVKVRFPDQSQVVAKFSPSDTGESLYGFVRSCLAPAFAGEKFLLNVFLNTAAARTPHAQAIPEADKLLIKDLGLAGRVLVNFTWVDAAPSAQRRTDILRPELRRQAQELKVEQPREPVEEPSAPASAEDKPSGSSKAGGARKSGGMPKWLKLPGKK